MKKKLLIDLDVITVAEWEKRDSRKEICRKFVAEVAAGKYEVFTPYTHLEHVSRWDNKPLAERIRTFYSMFSAEILPLKKIRERALGRGFDIEAFLYSLEKVGVKEDDGFLVMVARIFGLLIVTLNKRHLISKKEQINRLLERYKCDEVEILSPTEL